MDQRLTTAIERIKSIQEQICNNLTTLEPSTSFFEDSWTRELGGGGRTRVLEHGGVIEKGGVNFSHVYSEQLPPSATAHRPELAGYPFHAAGVSVVIHPKNPYAPTSHFNVRLFYMEREENDPVWWIGGGFDMTPYYGFEEDAVLFHTKAKEACDAYGDFYPRFKQWADDYFFLKHRQEPRGIGGIFFDDFNELEFEQSIDFLVQLGTKYTEAYVPIVQQRSVMDFGERERAFQEYRRGRYVEFNLVYDRGTLFGLQSQGRTESILMSLPPQVSWRYNWTPELGSPEAKLYDEFLPPRDWVNVL